MSKKKNNSNNIFAPWKHDTNYKLKDKDGNLEKQKRFIGIPHSLLMNKNTLELSASAFKTYIYLLDYACDKQTTKFSYSIAENFTTRPTFKSAIDELVKKGFLEIIQYGKFNKTPNIYKFSDEWKKIN